MPITGDIDLGQWLSTMYEDYTTGRAQREEMFGKGVGALEGYADIFRPGGEYGAGVEAMIGRGEEKAVAGGMQSLVSAGLAGTTMPMHLQQTYQEEVGMPTRMRAEDVRMERFGGALGSLGQMYAGYQPGGPTAGDIAHMATGGFGMQIDAYRATQQAHQAQLEARQLSQAGLSSQRMWDQPSGGGGAGGGGGVAGGGDTAWGYSEFSPSGAGAGGDSRRQTGFAEGELPVMMGGERMIPGTDIPWGKNVSRNAATGIESQLIDAGYSYDPNSGTYMAPTGGGGVEEIAPGGTAGGPSYGMMFQPGV